MKLGFHYHTPAMVDPDGRIHTISMIGVFIDSLAPHVERLVCFLYTYNDEAELEYMNYVVKAPNVEMISLGPHTRLRQRLLFQGRRIRRTIRQHQHKFELILVRAPTSALPEFARVLSPKRVIPYFVGVYSGETDNMVSTGITKQLALLWIWMYERKERQLAGQTPLVTTNSAALLETFKPLASRIELIRSTTLSNQDFFKREDTCQDGPVKVLFTGRIVPAKGLEDILDACVTLKKEGINIEFHYAGFTVAGFRNYDQTLLEIARSKNFGDHIFYHGMKKVGKELNAMYHACDIFVVASRGNFEGFPRTIWEAMANSIPVIAARSGSVPIYLNDKENALLFTSNNVTELTDNLRQLILDHSLRKRLIKNAYQLAQPNTLEVQGKKMVDLLKSVG